MARLVRLRSKKRTDCFFCLTAEARGRRVKELTTEFTEDTEKNSGLCSPRPAVQPRTYQPTNCGNRLSLAASRPTAPIRKQRISRATKLARSSCIRRFLIDDAPKARKSIFRRVSSLSSLCSLWFNRPLFPKKGDVSAPPRLCGETSIAAVVIALTHTHLAPVHSKSDARVSTQLCAVFCIR